MSIKIAVVAVALGIPVPATAQSDLQLGFEGALRGCENWVLEPASWADGATSFVEKLGLGDKAGWVTSVPEATLPPAQLRKGNHYLRINSTPNAGFVVVVSDRLPFCHITGGGNIDLQPVIETVLTSETFKERWKDAGSKIRDDMISTTFRYRNDLKFDLMISRARKVGGRLDRVQVLATAQYNISR
ncbi:MAG: hypothetical protein J0I80_09740 [Sphingomonas sp.]|mgnify:CR=1 FL=1|nr:hypothetical protein [Sphingomonas sp.]